ncbi:hypothetical protein Bca4012_076662 [Brassica carinata]
MIHVNVGVVVFSPWECSCPTFGCGFLIILELSIENHWIKFVIWYWKPPWSNKRKCMSCIIWILKRRLGQSSPGRLVYSCDRVIVMLMILENHQVGILRSSIMVVIDESLSTKVRSPKMFLQQNKLKIWLYWRECLEGIAM